MDLNEALRLLRGGEEGVESWNRRKRAGEAIPALREVDLRITELSAVDLARVDLREADLRGAILHEADLRWANLEDARLEDAILNHARLEGTVLLGANMIGAALAGADLSGARMSSCFLCYSSSDEELAEALARDIEGARIPLRRLCCDPGSGAWRGGDRGELQSRDKLVLIASASSLESAPVRQAIGRAIALERGAAAREREVLLPVRVDGHIFDGWTDDSKAAVGRKIVSDASSWRDPASYARVRDRLLWDLKAG